MLQLLHFSLVITIRIDYIKVQVLQIILSETIGIFWWSAQFMLHFMNSKVVEKHKEILSSSIRDGHVLNLVLFNIKEIS